MNRFFKRAALLAAITGIVWLAVLWRWETTRRDVTVYDIALYLAVLPLAVFGVWLGLGWAWRGAGPRRRAALAAAAADGKNPSATPTDVAAPDGTVQVLVAHLASNAGARPADVLAAVGQNERRPELDPELRDADGLAVMSARIANLPLDALSERLAPILAGLRAQRAEWSAAVPDERVVRALTILAEPYTGALAGLRPWAGRLGAPDRDATRPARPGPTDAAPRVRLLLGWPADWTDFERAAATEWARRQIPAHTDIPLDRFVIDAHAASSGEELWLRATQLLQTLAREQRSDLVLLTACHSDLSDSGVAALEQQQRLFSPRHRPKGSMPGEAAAALLLANADWPADPEADGPAVRLHRAALLRREESIEAPGRISSQCLQDSVGRALTAGGLAPADVAALVCDGDQHTPRGAELFGATLALLPHLEPSEDMRLLGVATGRTGIVNTLLVIATAAERTRLDAAPCLAVCVGDAFLRLAAVARSGQPPGARDAVGNS